MNIAICDDLREERAVILEHLRTYFSDPTLSEFENGAELVCAHEKTRFDLILLDMLMPGLNGIQTAENIRKYDAQTPIIFATTTEDFAVQSYRVLAFDYLLKPVASEAMAQCLSRFTKLVPDKRFISVDYMNVRTDILLSNIIYLESELRKVIFHLAGGEYIAVTAKLEQFVMLCDEPDFCRCHKSFLVNLGYVEAISGEAVFPHGTIDYYALYNCADLALYARKKDGRKGITFYSSDISGKSPLDDSSSAVCAATGAEEGTMMDEQLAQYAFRILYAAKDIESTINRLLEIIGRSYDVSRAYVFESSEDRKCCSNTFEWCADGVAPQIATLQNISYVDELGDYLSNFDRKGLFYCAQVSDTHPDVRAVIEPQGIHSMLQCAMLDEGDFVGYVGFDECRENRAWSSPQVATFKLTADVLSTFIMKLRQKQGQKSSINKQKM